MTVTRNEIRTALNAPDRFILGRRDVERLGATDFGPMVKAKVALRSVTVFVGPGNTEVLFGDPDLRAASQLATRVRA